MSSRVIPFDYRQRRARASEEVRAALVELGRIGQDAEEYARQHGEMERLIRKINMSATNDPVVMARPPLTALRAVNDEEVPRV